MKNERKIIKIKFKNFNYLKVNQNLNLKIINLNNARFTLKLQKNFFTSSIIAKFGYFYVISKNSQKEMC